MNDALLALADGVRHCDSCSLAKKFGPCVPGWLAGENAEVMLVGEGPGYEEQQPGGLPFSGPAGRNLNRLLKLAGLTRENVFVTNIIRQRVSLNNDVPNKEDAAICTSLWLEREIAALHPRIIVPVGATAIRYFLPSVTSVAQAHRIPRTVNLNGSGPITIFPVYHPAASLHNPRLLKTTEDDFKALGELLTGVLKPVEPSKPSAEGYYETTDTGWLADYLREAGEFSLDTEWDEYGFWGMSFSTKEGEGIVVRHGTDLEPIKALLLESEHLVWFHFAQADLLQLRKIGIEVKCRVADTSVQAYLLQEEEQGLKPLSYRKCGVEMTRYDDLIGEYGRDRALDYLREAAAFEYEKLPSFTSIDWNKKLGIPERKTHQPQPIEKAVKKLVQDIEAKGVNPYERWDNWDKSVKEAIEAKVGRLFPRPGISDAPEDIAVSYSCLTFDSLVLMADGSRAKIGKLVKAHSQEEVLAFDSVNHRLIPKKIIGWYRIPPKRVGGRAYENVEWFRVGTDVDRTGKWGSAEGAYFTSDHKILTTLGWKTVCELVAGDMVYTPVLDFSPLQRQLVLGALLGDGSISRRNNGGWAQFRVGHSEAQWEYLNWFAAYFTNHGRRVSFQTPGKGAYKNASKMKILDIHGHPWLSKLRSIAYPGKAHPHKRLNMGWLDELDWLALAVWYMDDGTLVNNEGARFYTLGFWQKDVELLQEFLAERFHLFTTARLVRHGQWSLGLSKRQAYQFFEKVAAFIPPGMQYKLPKQWRGRYDESTLPSNNAEQWKATVTDVELSKRHTKVRGYKVRYCIDVQDAHNFCTPTLVAHNCADSDMTLRLSKVQAKELESWGLTSIFWDVDAPVIPSLVDMTTTGITVDKDYLLKLQHDLGERIEKVLARMEERLGFPINMASPKQKTWLLDNVLGLELTKRSKKSGAISTDEDSLEPYKDNPVVADILEYQELSKLKGTYVDSYLEMMDGNNRVHTTFKNTRTATGRFASEVPNLQNVPKMGELGRMVRNAFIAGVDERGEQMMLLISDYSQIEMRTEALITNCLSMLTAFRNGEDIHEANMRDTFGVKIEDWQAWKAALPPGDYSDLRTGIKAVGFGIIFGITGHGLYKQNPGVFHSPEQAQSRIDRWLDVRPEVRAYMESTRYDVQQNGYVVDPLGRIRWIPEAYSKNRWEVEDAVRKAINMPAQAMAADIIKIAMAKIYRAMQERGLRSRMLLQVHDELVFECPVDELEEMTVLVRECMEHAIELPIPTPVEIKAGIRWAETVAV